MLGSTPKVTDSSPEAPVGSQSDGQICWFARTASAGRLFGEPLGWAIFDSSSCNNRVVQCLQNISNEVAILTLNGADLAACCEKDDREIGFLTKETSKNTWSNLNTLD